MQLTTERKKHFRSLGHNLKPVVTVAGNGLTDGVLAEAERALEDHELIKVKFAISDREMRQQAVKELCDRCRAQLIQEIGKVALVFREAKKPHPGKSNIRG